MLSRSKLALRQPWQQWRFVSHGGAARGGAVVGCSG